MSFRKFLALGIVVGVSTGFAGCGGGPSDAPETVAAKGTVTVDGTPMGKLSVAFIPANGKLATGETDDQGNFTLTTNQPGDGAVVGRYSVAISRIEEPTEAMPGMEGYKKPEPPPFANMYTDAKTSGLTATVDKDPSKNNFKFDLEKK
jgi:hypothetical protein